MSTAATEPATPIALPPGWGRAWLMVGPAPAAAAWPHARDGRGRTLLWRPPAGAGRCACDLEADEASRCGVAALLGVAPESFAARWVSTEVEAKIHAVPVVAWLRSRGLAPAPAAGAPAPLREAPGHELLYLRRADLGCHLALGKA